MGAGAKVVVQFGKKALKLIGTQILMSATTALIETSVAVTNQSLMDKMQEWGVDTSDTGFWGQLASEFQSNLGASTQMMTMQLSMGLTQSMIDPLEDSFQQSVTTMQQKVTSGVNAAKNKVGKAKIKRGFLHKAVLTGETYDRRVRRVTAVVDSGSHMSNSYTVGASSLESSYNSKNLEDLGLSNMDTKELVKVMNQLMILQKVG